MVQVYGTLFAITIDNDRPVLSMGFIREIPLNFDIDFLVGGNFKWFQLHFTIVPCIQTWQFADMNGMVERIIVTFLALIRDSSIVPGVSCDVDGLCLGCLEGQSVAGALFTANAFPDARVLFIRIIFELEEPLYGPSGDVHADPSLREVILIIIDSKEPYSIFGGIVRRTIIKKLASIARSSSEALLSPRIANLHQTLAIAQFHCSEDCKRLAFGKSS